MDVGISIQLDQDTDTLTPALRELRARMGNISAPLKVMGRALVTATKDRFRRSEGPAQPGASPTKWPPLAPATVSRRRKNTSTPLLDTGVLLRSINAQVRGDELHVGTDRQWKGGYIMAIHQLGGPAGRKSARVQIPPRPFLGIDAADRKEMLDTVGDYLGRGLAS